MKTVTEYAFAKLNLTLDVLGTLPNGYHAMQMVMQSVSLCDDLTVTAAPGSGRIRVTTNRSFLPPDQNNIAGKAARIFLQKIGEKKTDVTVHIHKRIPVCAGLAGGSADGAAVLRGLNRLIGAGLDRRQLEMLGEEVGSDVPYCVAGGTVLAEGRGEILRDLQPIPETWVVICKPRFSVSTPVLFRKLDKVRLQLHPDTDGMLRGLELGDRKEIARRIFNVFESVPQPEFETVREIKNALYDFGAAGAAMSGTGSAVFGLFEKEEEAAKAREALHAKYEECFLCRTVGRLKIE